MTPDTSTPSEYRYRGHGAHKSLMNATQALERVLSLPDRNTSSIEIQTATNALAELRELLEGGVGLIGEIEGVESVLAEKEQERENKVRQLEAALVQTKMNRAELLASKDEIAKEISVLSKGTATADDGEVDEETEREVKKRATIMVKSLKGVEDEIERVKAEMSQIAARRAALQERAKAAQNEL